jgi:hypothetical protein
MIVSAHRPARLLLLLIAGGCSCAVLLSPPQVAAAADPAKPQPVLVELFTSEGCSSCPPADALLARLDATQFVPGAQAIVLSEHVTYWNEGGWHDPFSFETITERQQQYETQFGLASSYTPQVVVDGAVQLVGNDAGALNRAVAHAALTPKADLAIDNVQFTGDAVHFSVRTSARAHAILTIVLAEDATQSTVAKGENAGRTLHHVAVVCAIDEKSASAADGRVLTLKLPAHTTTASQATPLRLVAFLTSPATGHVLALAEQTISRQNPPSDTRQSAAQPPAPSAH